MGENYNDNYQDFTGYNEIVAPGEASIKSSLHQAAIAFRDWLSGFEQEHPGTTNKMVGTTIAGAGLTLLANAFIIITA